MYSMARLTNQEAKIRKDVLARLESKALTKGSKVKLREDVLVRHARSVPAHAGYSREQFAWRDTLDKLEGKTGTIERTFPDSNHVNVKFGKTLIGLNKSELTQVKSKKYWK